jgi:hypothetical protein
VHWIALRIIVGVLRSHVDYCPPTCRTGGEVPRHSSRGCGSHRPVLSDRDFMFRTGVQTAFH